VHRTADLLALADVARLGRGLDQVVDEPVDASAAGGAEQLDLGVRQVALFEQSVAEGIVDVVVDVRDAVDESHDAALERLRLDRPRVRQDPFADLVGQVEPSRDPVRLLVVPEAQPEA
jgi:hypothetical protein